MQLDEFIALADKWQALGWAVQGQLKEILFEDADPATKNRNALVMIEGFLVAADGAGIYTGDVPELTVA